jgi:hypothetical protein
MHVILKNVKFREREREKERERERERECVLSMKGD